MDDYHGEKVGLQASKGLEKAEVGVRCGDRAPRAKNSGWRERTF